MAVDLQAVTVAHARAVYDKDGALLGLLAANGRVVGLGTEGAGSLYRWSVTGDSRSTDFFINPVGKNSKNWLVQAIARYGQSIELVGNYAIAGKRTDEYLSAPGFEAMLADASGVVVFGFPFINDNGQADGGYTDAFGRAVTAANVVDYAIGNLVDKIKRCREYGKRVIALMEPGGEGLTATQAARTHEFNRRYREALKDIEGVQTWSFNRILWNPTGSATLIKFKANFLNLAGGDTTHNQQAAGQACGKDFAANFLPSFVPKMDKAVSNINQVIANGVGQLFDNPLMATLAGGVLNPNMTITNAGTIPASVKVGGDTAGAVSVAITSAANADGLGNDVTYTFTSTAAGRAYIEFSIPNQANWELTDKIESGVEIDIGATAANVYWRMEQNSNLGTNTSYDLYSENSGPAPGQAETGIVLRTVRSGWLDGSTVKGYLACRLYVQFTANGQTCALTTRRAHITRYR